MSNTNESNVPIARTPPPMNPQELRRLNRMMKKKKHSKRSKEVAAQNNPVKKKSKEGGNGEVDVVLPAEEKADQDKKKKKKSKTKKGNKSPPIASAQQQEEQKKAAEMQEAIWSMKILPESNKAKATIALSAESIDVDAMDDVSITARGMKQTPSDVNTSYGMVVDLDKLGESPLLSRLESINQMLVEMKDAKARYAKIQSDVDNWYIKYERRLADLEVAMKSYEKRARDEIKDLRHGIQQFEQIASKNQEKRQRLEKILVRNAPVSAMTVGVRLGQTGFDILHALLYYIAVVRDFMFYRDPVRI